MTQDPGVNTTHAVKAARPAAAAFLIATVLIDALAFALIIPVMPSLLMELTGGI